MAASFRVMVISQSWANYRETMFAPEEVETFILNVKFSERDLLAWHYVSRGFFQWFIQGGAHKKDTRTASVSRRFSVICARFVRVTRVYFHYVVMSSFLRQNGQQPSSRALASKSSMKNL